MVGHYRQPSNKTKLKAELRYIVNSLRHRYPNSPVVIAGDFNEINLEAMKREADALNSVLATT